MVVLVRAAGKSVRIGDDIRITVISIGDDRVRIGVEAPRETTFRREEDSADLSDGDGGASGGK